jgi:hypothetical protein
MSTLSFYDEPFENGPIRGLPTCLAAGQTRIILLFLKDLLKCMMTKIDRWTPKGAEPHHTQHVWAVVYKRPSLACSRIEFRGCNVLQ